jgi:predicted  nucleic acid-binding Zn-ribbon protein
MSSHSHIHITLDLSQDFRRYLDCAFQALITNQEKIMTKVSEFGAQMKTYQDQADAKLDALQTATTGLQGDIKALNDKITALQNSPGEISADDQKLLDDIQAHAQAANDKLTNAAKALSDLDDLTPPAVPQNV